MKIVINPDQFYDILMFTLLDVLSDDDEEIEVNNEEFKDLLEVMRNKGIESRLIRYYLQSEPKMRIFYNRINNIFRGGLEDASILIKQGANKQGDIE